MSRACVVIVNRDDPGVADTLEALAQPGVADGARVVVVDASRGRFADVAARFPEVTWIPFEQPAGVSRTIAQQRNVGLVAAGEDVVVFLDANCRPVTGWLDALLATVDARTLAAGAVRSPSGNSLHDAEHPHAWREDGTLGECSTLNLALPPQAVAAVGRFDESLGFAEDVDFVWRAQEAGFVVRWCPEAVVTHAWGGASDERRRAFRYGVGRARLLRKHRRWRNLLGDDRATAFYALVLLGLPFVFVAPWYLAVLVLPLWRHRQHRPFATVAYGLVNAAGFLRELVRR